ncbi:triosephosphate isomerase, partial [mine drainage metagenome]
MTGTSTRSAPGRSGPGPLRRIEPGPLGRPLLLVNLKTYPSALGLGAERIARTLEELGRAAGVPVAVAPAAPDLSRLTAQLRLPVLAQHVDPVEPGPRTGFVPPEAVAAAGGRGSLVNHSEHPLSPAGARETALRLNRLGLVAVVCARDVAAARRLARVHPPYLAIEPPDLIGGDRSVSTARPEIILAVVRAVAAISPDTVVLCGAGVHTRLDVERAREL